MFSSHTVGIAWSGRRYGRIVSSIGLKLLGWLLLALFVSCGGGGSPPVAGSPATPTNLSLPPAGPAIETIPIVDGQPIRVLFVGNSLTQANDLPMMVTALAAGTGVQVQSTDVSQGGFSLEDHWNDQRAPRAVDRGGWHFVVMQQGPSALLSSRENLRLWAVKFNERIRAVGGRPALFMIWPEAARISEFDNVRQSYLLAAQDINGLFLPAGEAWRAAWRRAAGLQLYGLDDFHPSVLGTYTAALVITSKITSRSPIGMATDFVLPSGAHIMITPADAAIVQAAVAEVVNGQ
jgi:hypothetical protein